MLAASTRPTTAIRVWGECSASHDGSSPEQRAGRGPVTGNQRKPARERGARIESNIPADSGGKTASGKQKWDRWSRLKPTPRIGHQPSVRQTHSIQQTTKQLPPRIVSECDHTKQLPPIKFETNECKSRPQWSPSVAPTKIPRVGNIFIVFNTTHIGGFSQNPRASKSTLPFCPCRRSINWRAVRPENPFCCWAQVSDH